jgi:hypothetical protein
VKSNGGHRLARVLRRNAAKVDGRTLELANAPEIGEDSIAERTAAEHEAGTAGVMFHAKRPTVEPAPEMSDAQLLTLLEEVYAGAPWVDLHRLLREVRDPGAPWEEVLRFFFNLPSSGVLAAVDPLTWVTRKAQRDVADGERIALGFDGSKSRDATALVGCTADGYLWPILILERPANAPEGWKIDRKAVADALHDTFERYDVQWLYADPWQWQDEVDDWAEKWPGKVVELPTNSTRRMAPAVDRFRTAIVQASASHSGDVALSRHVLNARLKAVGRNDDGRGAHIIEKAGAGRFIDAAVAAILAYEAAAAIEPEPELEVSQWAWA